MLGKMAQAQVDATGLSTDDERADLHRAPLATGRGWGSQYHRAKFTPGNIHSG